MRHHYGPIEPPHFAWFLEADRVFDSTHASIYVVQQVIFFDGPNNGWRFDGRNSEIVFFHAHTHDNPK